MSTALTEYCTVVASSTISTSNQIVANITTGGAVTNKNTNLTALTTGWVMMSPQGGGVAQSGVGSEIAPNALGWFDDSTILEGQQILAGNWQFTLGFELGSVGGLFIGDVHYRAFLYNGVTYTLICEATAATQTITGTAFISAVATVTASASPTFATGNKLYSDTQLNITTNTTTANMRMRQSTLATIVSVNAQIVTPGFQPAPTGSVVIIGDGYGGVFT